MSAGPVAALILHLAANDPAELDAFEERVRADLDQPDWTAEERERVAEARRQLLARIAAAKAAC